MTISRNRDRSSGLVVRRLGLPGYTVVWTLCFWFGGLPIALLPTFFVAYPIAVGVQRCADRLKARFFS